MSIELKNLPSLIAIPYSETLKKDSIQRKDFQRLVLENALTLNSIIAISDFYNHNRKSSEDSEKKLNSLPNVPNIDLGQISVGTWNMFSREFSRVLKTEPKSVFLNNIVDLYHGSTAKEWENLAGSLISIRNKDAHGELIAADKLATELDKRQEIIEKFVNMLSFYNDYLLIVPYKAELIGGKINYICKEFNGLTESTVTISDSKDELESFRVYLYNKKNSTALCLNPMIVANPTSSENPDIKLFLYSKTNNKKLGNLHYLAIDSSRDFNFDVTEIIGDYFTPAEICEEFQSFRIVVEDPSLHDQKKPELNISRTLKSDFISKNDLIEMSLKIKNSGESIAENLEIKLNYAKNHFILCDNVGEELNQSDAIQQIIGDELNLESSQSLDYKFYFKPLDSGQYEFPSFTIEYEYTDYQGNTVKPKIDKDGVATNIEQVPAVYCTVFDPGDPYSLAPVINVNIDVDFGKDEKGNGRIYAYIGETIPLTVTLKNQGLGVAKDVDFTVFLPKGIEITGSSKHWNGNINPLQTVTKTYDLTLREPGIHSINIREIIYFNNDNESFKTSGGSYSLLVRNKPEVQYRQLMQNVWADLNLDDDEKDELSYFAKKFGKLIQDETKLNIEIDEKIKIIKSALSSISTSKGFKLLEKMASGDRILYAYNSYECPIMVVDYADRSNLKLYLRADLQGKYPQELITIKGLVRTIPMNKIGFDEPVEGVPQSLAGGTNMLKGLLGRAIGWIEKHDWLQLQMRNFFAKTLAISNDQLSAKLFTKQFYYKIETEDKNNDYLIREFATYFDEKNNLHLVAKVDADISTRRKLVEKGYKFMSQQGKDATIAYEDSTNATSFLYVGTQKINNDDDKQKFSNKLIQMLLTALEDQNQFLEDTLKRKGIEAEQISSIMKIHNGLLEVYNQEKNTLGLTGLIFKMNHEDKGKNYNLDITYYAIKELPLYQEKQIVAKITAKRNKFELNLRYLKDEIIEKINKDVSYNKGLYLFTISLNDFDYNYLISLLQFALVKTGNKLALPNYSYFKQMLENQWANGLDLFCEGLVESDGKISFENMINYFKQQESPYNFKSVITNLNKFETLYSIESFVEIDFINQSITLKNEVKQFLIDAVKNYEIVYDPDVIKWHNFKLIIANVIESYIPANKYLVLGKWSSLKSFWDGGSFMLNCYDLKIIAGINLSMKKDNIKVLAHMKPGSVEFQEVITKIENYKNLNDDLSIDNIKVGFYSDINKFNPKYRDWDNPTLASIEIPLNNIEDLNNIDYINDIINKVNNLSSLIFNEQMCKQMLLSKLSLEKLSEIQRKFVSVKNQSNGGNL